MPQLFVLPFIANPDEVARRGIWPWGALFLLAFPTIVVVELLHSVGFSVAGALRVFRPAAVSLPSCLVTHWLR